LVLYTRANAKSEKYLRSILQHGMVKGKRTRTQENLMNSTFDSNYSDELMSIRTEVLSILFKEFGNGSNNDRIYSCADRLVTNILRNK
tara:strand:+ start:1315 stop:1578 length:264 start_codon:yes stop_codon:yes gene_type:complete